MEIDMDSRSACRRVEKSAADPHEFDEHRNCYLKSQIPNSFSNVKKMRVSRQ